MRLAWAISLLILIVQCNGNANKEINLENNDHLDHSTQTASNNSDVLPQGLAFQSLEHVTFHPLVEEAKNSEHDVEEATDQNLQGSMHNEVQGNSINNTVSFPSLPKLLSTIGLEKVMLTPDLNNSISHIHEKENDSNDKQGFFRQGLFSDDILSNDSSSSAIIHKNQLATKQSESNISQKIQNTLNVLNKNEEELNNSTSLPSEQHSFENSMTNHLTSLRLDEENQNSINNEHQWISNHLDNSHLSNNQVNLAQEIIRAHEKDDKNIENNLKENVPKRNQKGFRSMQTQVSYDSPMKQVESIEHNHQANRNKHSMVHQIHPDEKTDSLEKLTAALLSENAEHNESLQHAIGKRILPHSEEHTIPVADASTSKHLGIDRGILMIGFYTFMFSINL